MDKLSAAEKQERQNPEPRDEWGHIKALRACKRMICVVVAMLMPGSFCFAAGTDVPRFMPGKQVGTVQTKEIKEASGIVASRMNRGVLWVHNDSGNSARIYALNSEGKLLGTYRLKGIRCRDWEDIAIGPGPDPQRSYLYIGDIGDNDGKYPYITVYRVAEPAVDPNVALSETQIGPVEAIELKYPDGPKDAETLLVDPLNGDIYVIAKRELFCRVYRAAHRPSTATQTAMELVATLPWGFAVGGDVSPDGQWVIVRGPFNASLWRRPEGKELWRAFTTEGFSLQLMRERQGEGICFDQDGRGYFTIGEQTRPPIYYFAGSSSSQKSNTEPSN